MEMEVESYILYLLVYIKKHVLLQWVMKYYIEKNANLMLNISGENAVQVNCGFVTWALLSLDLPPKALRQWPNVFLLQYLEEGGGFTDMLKSC